MADFPTDLSAQRPSGDMKDDLDDFLDSVREMFSGGFEAATPVAGALTVNKGICYVQGAGATSISSISTGQLQQDRAIVMIAPHPDNSSLDLTVTTGAAVLRGGSNMVMTSALDCLILRNTGGTWLEIGRFEFSNTGLISHLALGTAAFIDEGPGNGLDADKLDGVEGAGYLLVAGKAADSNLLDGLDSTAFPTLADTAEQEFAGALKTTAGLLTIEHISTKPFLKMWLAADERVNIGMQPDESLEIVLFDDNLNRRGTLRISETNGDLYYTNDDEAGSEKILTPGKSDALTLRERPSQDHVNTFESGLAADILNQNFSQTPVTIPGTAITLPTYVTNGTRVRCIAWVSWQPGGSGANPNFVELTLEGAQVIKLPSVDGGADRLDRMEATFVVNGGDVIDLRAGRDSGGDQNNEVYGDAVFSDQETQTRTHVLVEILN